MSKSIFLTSPGRCGTHWIGWVLRELFGLEKEENLRYKYCDNHLYVDAIKKQEIEQQGKIYIKHIPLGDLAPIEDNVDIIAVLRDPRDIIISAIYYLQSRKEKHDESLDNFGGPYFNDSFQDMLNHYVQGEYQSKWFSSYMENCSRIKHHLIRYETMVFDPRQALATFRNAAPEKIQVACQKYSFEKFSAGRKIGQEDKSHHFRKGVVGDWQNYLTNEQNVLCQKNYRMSEIGYKEC